MKRDVRYQGAILRGGLILLIRHSEHHSAHSYWLLPGGGRESRESEEECVRREMLEETGLDVVVDRLLLDEPSPQGDSTYRRHRTFLCHAPAGEATPGYEPEPDAALEYEISEVCWFDLSRPETWGSEIHGDAITLQALRQLREVLGLTATG